MGSHSSQAKRIKRRNRKKKKRIVSNSSAQDTCSSVSSPDHHESSEDTKQCNEPIDIIAKLDALGDEFMKYWSNYKESLESYNDVYPAIVSDSTNKVDVYINGGRKETAGLVRVSTEHYFSSLQERESKSRRMCKICES